MKTPAPANPDNDDKPLDPAVERVRARMMRLMAISIGIMMTGLMAVLGAIVYKVSARPGAERASPAIGSDASIAGSIDLPDGARIVSSSLAGSDILIEVQLADGKRQFVVYRIAEDRIIAKVSID